MNNAEKARELCKLYQANRASLFQHLLAMAEYKDEQIESKLMQIIILAQQGYTSGATDEMILKHCKEIINENYEHNTTKTD